MIVLGQVFKLFYRVLSHLYFSHFDQIVMLQEEAHLNTLFLHFMTFALTFDLLDKKEYVAMKPFLSKLNLDDLAAQSTAEPLN